MTTTQQHGTCNPKGPGENQAQDQPASLWLLHLCLGTRRAPGAHFKGIEKHLFPDLQRTCSACTRSSISESSNWSTISLNQETGGESLEGTHRPGGCCRYIQPTETPPGSGTAEGEPRAPKALPSVTMSSQLCNLVRSILPSPCCGGGNRRSEPWITESNTTRTATRLCWSPKPERSAPSCTIRPRVEAARGPCQTDTFCLVCKVFFFFLNRNWLLPRLENREITHKHLDSCLLWKNRSGSNMKPTSLCGHIPHSLPDWGGAAASAG